MFIPQIMIIMILFFSLLVEYLLYHLLSLLLQRYACSITGEAPRWEWCSAFIWLLWASKAVKAQQDWLSCRVALL